MSTGVPGPVLNPRGTRNSAITPVVVIRPMESKPDSVNHRFPSGPAAIPNGRAPNGRGNSVIVPAGVTHAGSGTHPCCRDPPNLVCGKLGKPEVAVGPATMPVGNAPGGRGNSTITPSGEIRATLLAPASVNQTFPSSSGQAPQRTMTSSPERGRAKSEAGILLVQRRQHPVVRCTFHARMSRGLRRASVGRRALTSTMGR